MAYTEPSPNNSMETYTATGSVPTKEPKASTLYSTIHTVMEVRDSLSQLQNLVGSQPRPCEDPQKIEKRRELDPANLVQVIDGLHSEVSEICAMMLVTISELKEDLT